VLEIVSYSFGDIPLLSIAGEFDHFSLPLFRQKVDEALAADGRRLLLQMTDCAYIDSSGISSLLGLLHRVRNHGWLGTIDPSPDVLRLLQLVGLTLDPCFHVFPDLAKVEEFLEQGSLPYQEA